MRKIMQRAISLLLVLVMAVTPVFAADLAGENVEAGIAGSDLPQVYITVTDDVHSGLELTKDTGYVSATVKIIDPTGEEDTLTDAGSQVKVRGNSTAWGAKRPYNIKLSSKTKVLGMGKAKKWCLLANMFDKSLMRNKLVYEFARNLGMDYVPEFQMVDVWMDGTYVGSYMLCSAIEAGSKRIDIDVDNGDYLFERERERYEDDVTYVTTSRYGVRFAMSEPEEPTGEQYTGLVALLNQVEDAIATNDYDTMAQYMDLESFANLYLVEELFKDVDVNYSSVYFYFKDGILYAGPVWDFDLTSGNCASTYYYDYNNVGGSGNSYEGFYASTAIWFGYLLENAQFAAQVKARFNEVQPLIVNLYEDNELGQNRIDETLAQCGASFAANWTVWDESSQDSDSERVPLATFAENVEYLRSWLRLRNEWIQDRFAGDTDFSEKLVGAVNYSNLPSGVYTIANAADPSYRLDVDGQSMGGGANVHVWSAHGDNSQKWIFWSMGNGYYTIENLNSGKYLDVCGGSTAQGANVWQYAYNGSDAQQWRIKANTDGTCTLVSKCGDVVLDMNGGGQPANGTNIQVWDGNESSAQKWVLKPQAVLQDGCYSINNAADSRYGLDVADVSKDSGANVQIWWNSNTDNQKFQITADADGYYTITAVHSGKVLDVAGGGTGEGTNVNQYEANGTNSQKWLAIPYNGAYIFISKCNGLALDMNGGGQPADGTNVQCWTINWSTAQLWQLNAACVSHVPVTDPAVAATCTAAGLTEGSHCEVCGAVLAAQETVAMLEHTPVTDPAVAPTAATPGLTEGSHCEVCGAILVAQQTVPALRPDVNYSNLPSGVYTIANLADTNYRLDVDCQSRDSGANVHIWSAHGDNSQKWIFWSMGNGYYTIQNLNSGKYLDVSGASAANGTNVLQYSYNGGNNQQWKIVDNGDGSCTLISRCGNVALDMNGGGQPVNGTNLQVYARNGSSAQKWVLAPQAVLSGGVYTVCAYADSGYCLDVSGVSQNNGANVQIWQNSNGGNQKFQIEAGADGYYTLTAIHSGKVLDVSGAGTSVGTNVHQYEANGTDAQKWLAIPYNGAYIFISKCNGLALDMNGGGQPANGTNIQCWTLNGSTAQMWNLR